MCLKEVEAKNEILETNLSLPFQWKASIITTTLLSYYSNVMKMMMMMNMKYVG